MNSIIIDWNQVILLVIGSLIGFLFSTATVFVQRRIDKVGSTRIYYKFTDVEGNVGGWGFYGADNGYINLWLPVLFEFENTKYSQALFRDTKISLFYKKKFVADTTFIRKIEKSHQVTFEQESNSFVIAGQGVNRYRCLYMLKIPANETEKYRFDRLKIHYYDFNGKEVFKLMRLVDGDWKIDNKGTDNCFLLVK